MLQHKNRISTFAAITVFSVFLCGIQESAHAQAAKPSSQTPSTPTTGQRIGQVIKDAIGTAFPGVAGIGGLIDAIWKNKQPKDKMDKGQATQAAKESEDTIRKSVVAQAQQKLVPLAEVADELQIVSQFGVPTATASENVVRMIERLKAGKTGQDDWTAQREDWEVAKGELQTIKNVPDLSKVQDFWLRDKLSKIQQSNITTVARVDTELKLSSPNIERLTKNLEDLYSTLKDISAAVGYEVSNLQADLKSLSDWAKGAAGAEETGLTPEGKKYADLLNKRYQ